MPYATEEDLPPPVRTHLPTHAQEIFRAAFNSAWNMLTKAKNVRKQPIGSLGLP